MRDLWGAFCCSDIRVKPAGEGVLRGKTFAVKDVFDIEGYVPGAGSPDWKRTHAPAKRHAAAIVRLLDAGARLVGTTQTDELMFSLNGENVHYGTPVNPRAVGRIPGGSSSGSAVAVAAGMVDFALGTDTGGSVRIPASYCGVYGFRPTHGAVPMDGVVPLAPGFDTVGWFARDGKLLFEVGSVLLNETRKEARGSAGEPDDRKTAERREKADAASLRPMDESPAAEIAGIRRGQPPSQPHATSALHDVSVFRRILIGRDAFSVMDPASREAIEPLAAGLAERCGIAADITIAEEGLEEWVRVFRILQGGEIWRTHRRWIEQVRPRFGPGIAERFAWSRTISRYDAARETAKRQEIRRRMAELLGEDGLLVIPTAPGPAPLCNTQGGELERLRNRTLQLCCIAGLAGLPQATLPCAELDGMPLGLSVVAGPGQDLRLLRWLASFEGERRLVPSETAVATGGAGR